MGRKLKNRYFKTHEGFLIVKGKHGFAIYDLISGDIYSLCKEIGEILWRLDNTNLSLDEALMESLPEGKGQILQVLKKLQELGIGNFYKKKIFIPKLKLPMEKELLESVGKIELETLDCEISKDCYLNCIHCKKEENIKKVINCGCRKVYNLKDSLTLRDWKRVKKDAALFKCKKIRFIGGEPFLLRNKLLELIELAQQLKYSFIEIFTNAILIDEKVIEYLRVFKNLFLTVPIYSFNPIIHDSITGINGSFKEAMGKILKMKDSHININIY